VAPELQSAALLLLQEYALSCDPIQPAWFINPPTSGWIHAFQIVYMGVDPQDRYPIFSAFRVTLHRYSSMLIGGHWKAAGDARRLGCWHTHMPWTREGKFRWQPKDRLEAAWVPARRA
jgi:hypothetical protein